jgi:sigma-B regulation protein RsbU (phosphoserine phosphatase)
MAGLLPRSTPSLEGFEIAVVLDFWHEVGGDYYDFIPLGNDRWAIAIADVVGKGIPAALLVAALRASLYSLAGQDLALRALFSRANRFFHEAAGSQGKFVTLFYAVVDLKARRLIYVNAGHVPPVLLRANGEVEFLQEGGLPLGPFEAPRYFEEFARLQSGDLIALYTDGITEAMDERDEQFDIDRLVDGLRRAHSRPAAEICQWLIREVKDFSGSQPADDMTLLIMKVL